MIYSDFADAVGIIQNPETIELRDLNKSRSKKPKQTKFSISDGRYVLFTESVVA